MTKWSSRQQDIGCVLLTMSACRYLCSLMCQPSERLEDFIKRHAKQGIEAMYSREAPPSDLSHCFCCARALSPASGQKGALFRCLDCPLSLPQCSVCVLASHKARPFDRIRQWCPKCHLWVKATIPELDFVLYLGHEGEPCPSTPTHLDGSLDTDSRLKEMLIIHEHGQISVRALFCQCTKPRVSQAIQLLEAGLWPATWLEPRTAITLATLETFHSLSLLAHVNVLDYVAHLNRLTDAVCSEDVKVRKLQSQFMLHPTP